MAKSVWDLSQEEKRKYDTERNTFEMFPIGSRVKIITPCQDFNFFYGETGIVTKNSGQYLGIIVKFDQPRHFRGGHIQYDFNFAPDDLLNLDRVPERMFEL